MTSSTGGKVLLDKCQVRHPGSMWRRAFVAASVALAAAVFAAGCNPSYYRTQADGAAGGIITAKQKDVLGKTAPFTVEPAADTLRRRLLTNQKLATSGPASFGSDTLPKVKHWPEKKTPAVAATLDDDTLALPIPDNAAVRLTLLDALQVAARNNRDYQSAKEDIFRSALGLELERDAFRNTFAGLLASNYRQDLGGADPVGGFTNTGDVSVSHKFQTGAVLTAHLAIDLVKLLTGDRNSSFGILADATLTIPLLRGSGRYIVTEPMTQAERDVVYSMWSFERFKRTLAVRVATDYLSVLQQLDQVKNAEDNYRSLVTAWRRARRLSDAGRLSEIQVDQAKQNELAARQRWISAQQSYESRLDSFRVTLGLPADANVDLDRKELERLAASAKEWLAREQTAQDLDSAATPPGDAGAKPAPALSADAPVTLVPASREGGGPYEIETDRAVKLALESRLDLKTAHAQVVDAQRRVVVTADALRAGLDLTFDAAAGEGRSLGSADEPNARLRLNKGTYSGGLLLDLPLERTAQGIDYRNSYIALERAVRAVQDLEDRVKLDVRGDLRNLLQTRESFRIQTMAVELAARRVRSTQVFLEAGRAEIRDLLEAQSALVSAQDDLTAALVGYRVAELQIQRDMDVLDVNEKGLWHEYTIAQPR